MIKPRPVSATINSGEKSVIGCTSAATAAVKPSDKPSIIRMRIGTKRADNTGAVDTNAVTRAITNIKAAALPGKERPARSRGPTRAVTSSGDINPPPCA